MAEYAKDMEKHWITKIPTQTDLEELDEKESPSLHWYITMGTKQITIRKAWKTYIVASRGWKPKDYKIKIKAGFYTLIKTESMAEAKEKFISLTYKMMKDIHAEKEAKRKLNMQLLIKETEE